MKYAMHCTRNCQLKVCTGLAKALRPRSWAPMNERFCAPTIGWALLQIWPHISRYPSCIHTVDSCSEIFPANVYIYIYTSIRSPSQVDLKTSVIQRLQTIPCNTWKQFQGFTRFHSNFSCFPNQLYHKLLNTRSTKKDRIDWKPCVLQCGNKELISTSVKTP